MTRCTGSESGEGGGDLRKQGIGMLQLSLIKGWVGRGALSLALLAGALAIFLMSGGLGEGQERCDVDECIEYPEHGSGAVIAFTALDPEEEDVTWTISNAGDISPDEGDFEINDGRLAFAETPDYEDPKDASPADNVYQVTIVATDTPVGGGVPLEAERDTIVTRTLKVTVTNVEEPGEVDLTTLQPQEGVAITATLTDLDGKPRGTFTTDLTDAADGAETAWQWARSTRVSGSWTDIEDNEDTENVKEGQAPSYTPTKDDVGMYLRATATYQDGHCDPCDTKKTAHAISANPVQADPRNKPPEFLDENGIEPANINRSVAENSAVGTAVGAPVTATDPGFDGRQETLTYVLSGGSDFDIDSGTGQIRVRDELDYEDTSRQTHPVTVSATDPSGGTDSVTVNISVTDVDEAPTITAGSTSVDYEENTPVDEEVDGYTAEDPDGDHSASLKWSLSGQDAARFAIGNRDRDSRAVDLQGGPGLRSADGLGPGQRVQLDGGGHGQGRQQGNPGRDRASRKRG